MKVRRRRSSDGVLLRVVEDEAVHHLDRRRAVLENRRRRFERFEQIGELDRQHRFRRGSGTSLTFASRTTPSVPSEPTISRVRLNGARRVDERVEVVAADAAQDLRVTASISRRVVARKPPDVAVARRLERVAGGRSRRARLPSSGAKCATEPSERTTCCSST